MGAWPLRASPPCFLLASTLCMCAASDCVSLSAMILTRCSISVLFCELPAPIIPPPLVCSLYASM